MFVVMIRMRTPSKSCHVVLRHSGFLKSLVHIFDTCKWKSKEHINIDASAVSRKLLLISFSVDTFPNSSLLRNVGQLSNAAFDSMHIATMHLHCDSCIKNLLNPPLVFKGQIETQVWFQRGSQNLVDHLYTPKSPERGTLRN